MTEQFDQAQKADTVRSTVKGNAQMCSSHFPGSPAASGCRSNKSELPTTYMLSSANLGDCTLAREENLDMLCTQVLPLTVTPLYLK